ncbi:hypothetical protein ABTD78_21845, partial [Acinetobacter baumannii]
GTKGELLAGEYIVAQYKQLGLLPAGSNGYIQEFEINEGKQILDNSFLKLDGKLLELNEDYIPLAFSKGGSIKSVPSTAMNESGMP